MAKIQIVARPNAGCDFYRCVLPAMHLQKDTEWCKTNSIEMLWIAKDEHKIDCDILIYNKLIGTPIHILKGLQKKGMKIIVDIDDLWHLPPGHAHERDWNGSGNNKLTEEHMKMADLITCTSMRLRETILPFNKNVVVIPNAVVFGQGDYKPSIREPHDKMAFIYAGGVSHLPDVELLSGKFKRIGGDPLIKRSAEFIIAGYEKQTQKKYFTKEDYQQQNNNFKVEQVVGYYDKMVNIFSYTGAHKVIRSLGVTKYMQCYDQADVSLVPLVDNRWNSMKSELKLIEAGCKKIPVIVSNVAPYSDVIEFQNEGAMLVNTPDDWIKYIKYCIKNPNFVTDAGEKLLNWTSDNYNLIKWNETRKQLFKSLINN